MAALFISGYVRNKVYEQSQGHTTLGAHKEVNAVNGAHWHIGKTVYRKDLLEVYTNQGYAARHLSFAEAAQKVPAMKALVSRVGLFEPMTIKVLVPNPSAARQPFRHSHRFVRLRVRVNPSDKENWRQHLLHTVLSHDGVTKMVGTKRSAAIFVGNNRVDDSGALLGILMRNKDTELRIEPSDDGPVISRPSPYTARALVAEDMQAAFGTMVKQVAHVPPPARQRAPKALSAAASSSALPKEGARPTSHIERRALELIGAELAASIERVTAGASRKECVRISGELIGDPMQVSLAVERAIHNKELYIGEEVTDAKAFWKKRNVNMGELVNEISGRVHAQISESIDADGFFRTEKKGHKGAAHIGSEMGGAAPSLFVPGVARAAVEREAIACGLVECFRKIIGIDHHHHYDNGGPDLGPCAPLSLHAHRGRCGGLATAAIEAVVPHAHRCVRTLPHHSHHHGHGHHHCNDKNVIEQTVVIEIDNKRRKHKKKHTDTVVAAARGAVVAKKVVTEEDEHSSDEEDVLLSRTQRKKAGLPAHSKFSDDECDAPTLSNCQVLDESKYSNFLALVRKSSRSKSCVYLALSNDVLDGDALKRIGAKYERFLEFYRVGCQEGITSVVDSNFVTGDNRQMAVLVNDAGGAYRCSTVGGFRLLNHKLGHSLETPDFCTAKGFGAHIRFLPFPSFHTHFNF